MQHINVEGYTIDGLIDHIRTESERLGSQRQWAIERGVSATYVNDVISGRRNPSHKILRALKLRPVVIYVPAVPAAE